MYKRISILFGLFMFLFCGMFFMIDYLSNKENLRDVALNQQSYNLKISDVRGNIYDCNNKLLVNKEKKLIAAVIPCTESLTALTGVVEDSKKEELYSKCSKNVPFTIEIMKPVKCQYVKIFEVPIRFSGITLAPHIIGYLSGDKIGVCGIEREYNDYLSGKDQCICVKYDINAAGKLLSGKKEFIKDKSYLNSKGIVLNIDEKIQTIAEETAGKYIDRGAVIVSEVPNCELRACVSVPGFSPQNIVPYLNDKNSPLLNRILTSFNLGSIFKIITSASAIEYGIDSNFVYDCRGSNKVEDATFRCYGGKKHGEINMEQAMAYSCNGYFVELIKKIPPNFILKMSKKFRLGHKIKITPEMISSGGVLPSLESLENIKTLANFSFGQGKLMATPLQVIGIVNSVASGGIYFNPKLIKGLCDENMKIVNKKIIRDERERIISENTANKLKDYMRASVEYGTSLKCQSEFVTAGAKTSTAQTGIVENNKKIEQSWIAGFFPFDKPKYCIVVLSEAGRGGGESCGPVFKEISERITTEILNGCT